MGGFIHSMGGFKLAAYTLNNQKAQRWGALWPYRRYHRFPRQVYDRYRLNKKCLIALGGELSPQLYCALLYFA